MKEMVRKRQGWRIMRTNAAVTSPRKAVSWTTSVQAPVAALVMSSVNCVSAPRFSILGRSPRLRLCTSSIRMRKLSVAPA